MSERRRIGPIVAVAIIVLLGGFITVLAVAAGRSTETADSPLIMKPAPAVVSTTYDGDTFDLSRRRGSWVVLNFFNSTCVPCKREHPELVKFVEAQQADGTLGVELFTVVNDDDEDAVRKFFAENGGDWPIVRDDDSQISVAFGVAKVPETWIISPTGVVVERFTGQVTAEILGATLEMMSGGAA
ncbi:MAG: TlpA family protein disulfide reductase [Actinobacteria bacterium]|nr:TlpA family protein disulfide reductase [Actinomycetota bacterium]